MAQGIVWCDEGIIGRSRPVCVWSLMRGPPVGEPCETTPGHREASRVPREINHLEQGPLDETGALDSVFEEWSQRRLRLGWGVANPA